MGILRASLEPITVRRGQHYRHLVAIYSLPTSDTFIGMMLWARGRDFYQGPGAFSSFLHCNLFVPLTDGRYDFCLFERWSRWLFLDRIPKFCTQRLDAPFAQWQLRVPSSTLRSFLCSSLLSRSPRFPHRKLRFVWTSGSFSSDGKRRRANDPVVVLLLVIVLHHFSSRHYRHEHLLRLLGHLVPHHCRFVAVLQGTHLKEPFKTIIHFWLALTGGFFLTDS